VVSGQCATCGTVNPDGAKFCSSCGASLAPIETVPAGMCLSCGYQNAESAAFCSSCGASLRAQPPETQKPDETTASSNPGEEEVPETVWVMTKSTDGTNEYRYEYDQYGQLTVMLIYVSGTLDTQYTYTYDANGNVLSYTCKAPAYHYTAKGSYAYTYQANGLISSKTEYYENGTEYTKEVYEYNSYGYLVKTTYYMEGSLYSYSVYEYDSSGRNQKTSHYYSGVLNSYDIYENGLLTKSMDASGNKIAEYRYNAYGNCTEECYYYDTDGNIYTTVYTKYAYTYDRNGNMITAVCTDYSSNTTVTTTYEYMTLSEYLNS